MDIVILGGGYAGVSAATRLAHAARPQGTPVRIRLVNPQPVLIERIRLHQAATGQKLRERRMDALLRQCGVEWVEGSAERIDLERQLVHVGGDPLPWDRLVVALGSRAGSGAVPGAAEHAWTLDAGQVPGLLDALRTLGAGARVAVVGGGLTGIEAASEIAEAFPGLRVQLLSQGPVADGFSPAGRDHIAATLGVLGVQVHEHVGVQAVEKEQLATGHGPVPFDICVWTAGFSMPSLPRDAGLAVNAHGQVRVDPMLRSISHPHVYAAGDIAAPVEPPGQPLPMGCKSALPMGAHVGENLSRELRGEPPAAFDYALMFYCVSLGRRDGLIQWSDKEGALTGRILTGRRAALFKEVICRTTWWSLRLEAKGRKAVAWKKTGRVLQELAAA